MNTTITIINGPSKWDLQVALFGTRSQVETMYITIDGINQPQEVSLVSVGHIGQLVTGTDFEVTFQMRWGDRETYKGKYNTSHRKGFMCLVE